ncbi:hypothetical protein [Aquimarina pacifica]|uniref:hypothetical protein n=1 Tax=Aquimarina pacifica TaxID=1296415 RepID=UPI000471064D|nr:hypothetical protein [Aquimarina pacifica]
MNLINRILQIRKKNFQICLFSEQAIEGKALEVSKKKYRAINRETIESNCMKEKKANDFIRQVEFLYFEASLEVPKIVAFFLIPSEEAKTSKKDKTELQNYISEIIRHQKKRKENLLLV